MQIIDNYVSTLAHKKLLYYYSSDKPSWKFMTNVTFGIQPIFNIKNGKEIYKKRRQASFGFSSDVFDSGNESNESSITNQEAFELCKPIIINREKLLRIRVGMIVNSGPEDPHDPHIDQPHKEHWTQLYYLTASDGPTNVFEEYGPEDKYIDYNHDQFTLKFQSKPEPNRSFIFDGFHWHSSSHVYGPEVRIALTLNYAK